jgi:hypothetical protein
MQYLNDTELSSHEGTRCQFNGGTGAIKLGIDLWRVRTGRSTPEQLGLTI